MDPELNVRARLLLTRTMPFSRLLEAQVTIWWLADRFHVRDESGRLHHDVLADATAPRGFGRPPRTMEGFMDTFTELKGHVDVYGDRSAERGIVRGLLDDVFQLDTTALLPAADRLFAGDVSGLTPTGQGRVLGRECTEYTTFLEGEDDGAQYRSRVTRLVAGPYVMAREVTDTGGASMRMRTEVVALDEGVVTSGDVRADTGPPV